MGRMHGPGFDRRPELEAEWDAFEGSGDDVIGSVRVLQASTDRPTVAPDPDSVSTCSTTGVP